MRLRPLLPFLLAIGLALPATLLRLTGVHLSPPLTTLTSGGAILAASFLLLWACDAVQADISQALALAVVALIAVLPEYAVDMYFTWQAGQDPAGEHTHYAIANMTGANRLLIGVAWGLIALIYWLRHRRPVRLGPERRTELFFLALATVYAFLIPLKGSLAWYDGLVFLGIYVAYIAIAGRRPCVEVEADGPAEVLIQLPKVPRRIATGLLFLFAAGVILANAEPFCEGLVATGKLLNIDEFLLVQWLAPIASEAPEFTVALVFAWRGQASLALGSLVSAKLNQWTLLVGMIPGVFALSSGSLSSPLPMGELQMHEIMLTAAQSLLAVVLLASLRFSLTGALLLFSLFIGQLLSPMLIAWFPDLYFGMPAKEVHPYFGMLYLTAAATTFLQRPRRTLDLVKGLRLGKPTSPQAESVCAGQCSEEELFGEVKSAHCLECRWRLSGIRALRSELQHA